MIVMSTVMLLSPTWRAKSLIARVITDGSKDGCLSYCITAIVVIKTSSIS